VGIGTASPAGKLDILTGTNRGYFDDSAGSLFRLNAVNAINSAYSPLSLNGSILTFQINGIESARIDTSGNVGIGTTSPGSKLDVSSSSNVIVASRSTGGYAAFQRLAPAGQQTYDFYTINGVEAGRITVDSSNFMAFATGSSAAERMRIDSSGNLLVGTTSSNGGRLQVESGGAGQLSLRNSAAALGRYWKLGPDSSGSNMVVYNENNIGCYIAYGNSTWSSSSDEREKDIIEPIADAVAKIASLRAIIGSYKNDKSKKRHSFLIAQDVQAVLPEAVDASNPDNLGLAYSEVIPLLVAAIQELSAKNDALEARLAALEAK
jgi:hypothetical protein